MTDETTTRVIGAGGGGAGGGGQVIVNGAPVTDETAALAALLRDEIPIMPTRGESDQAWHEWYAQFALNLADRGVRVAPSPTEGKYERVIHAAFDVDGAWDAEDTDGAPILWHAEAGEVLADLRTAIEALGDDEPWYSVLREDDTPIRTVTTPDGQVHRPESVRAASERLGIPIGHVRDYPYRFAPFEDDYEPGVAPSPETPGLREANSQSLRVAAQRVLDDWNRIGAQADGYRALAAALAAEPKP